jgi:hypothetical protein
MFLLLYTLFVKLLEDSPPQQQDRMLTAGSVGIKKGES